MMDHAGRAGEPRLTSALVPPGTPGSSPEPPEVGSHEPQAMAGYLTLEVDISELHAYGMEPRASMPPTERAGEHGQETDAETFDWTDGVPEDMRLGLPERLPGETMAFPGYLTIEMDETSGESLT
ncbi:MAG: hypothetical protein AB7N91_01550 [Candidatus Tectimicrobiota bacterium]